MSSSPSVLASIESDLNSLWANTLGVVWRASTGTVDPWTEANITAGAQTDVAQALGPNADPAAIAAAQAGQVEAITGYLTSIGEDSSQALTSAGPNAVAGLSSSAGAVVSGAVKALGTPQGMILILILLAIVFVYGFARSR